MAFVDITGVVDADTDGIVFEGKPLERPIIPRFIVPKNLARRLAKLTEGDAIEIENQRRAGNTNIQFDEAKLRSLIGGIDGRPEQLQDARSARSRASMRSLIETRNNRTSRSLRGITKDPDLAKRFEEQTDQAYLSEKRIQDKRIERNRNLTNLALRVRDSGVTGILKDDENEEAIAAGELDAQGYASYLMDEIITNSLNYDDPLYSFDEYNLRATESLFVEYGQTTEPLSPEEQAIVIGIRAKLKQLERQQSTMLRRGGNERSLPFSRISSEDFAASTYGKGWIYPDGTIYPVRFYHSDEHDYAHSFDDGLIRLSINRAGVGPSRLTSASNAPGEWVLKNYEGNIGVELQGTPSDDAIDAIAKLVELLPHDTMFIDYSDEDGVFQGSWQRSREDVQNVGLKEALTTPPSSRSMRSARSIDMTAKVQRGRKRHRETLEWNAERKQKGLEKNAQLLSMLDGIMERFRDGNEQNSQNIINSADKVKSFVESAGVYDNLYPGLPRNIRADLLNLLMEHVPESPEREQIIKDLKATIAGLDAPVRTRRGANPRPMALKAMSADEFARTYYWGAWVYPDGSFYPVHAHELEFSYHDAYDDGMIRLMAHAAGDVALEANSMTDEQLDALKKFVKAFDVSSLTISRQELSVRRHGKGYSGIRDIGEITIFPDTPESTIEKLLTTEDFSDTNEFLPSWMQSTAPATMRSTRMVRPKTARKRDMDPEEPLSEKIWDTYEIRQTDDGVHYARDISYEHVRALRNGIVKPPMLPFFAPLGGGNNQRTGEGYYFSVTGRRFYGRYGASGALVRRRNKQGNYEYLLARRSPHMSVGAGKWSFPGGAHRDKFDSELPGITAVDEFMQEVGGDIRAIEPVYSFTDFMAPDWSYDTHVYEVGPKDLRKLRPRDGENTEVDWFTADEILTMRDNDELLPSFARRAQQVITQSGDTSVVSARSVRSVVPDDSVPGEPSRVDVPRTSEQIEDELNQISKAMAALDERLDSGELTLDEYRKEQIPLRKRSAELGKERAKQSGRRAVQTERSVEAPNREPRVQERIVQPEPQQEWDSAVFLEQQRQKQIAWMRGLGFSDEEINILMSPSPTPLSSRSRRTGKVEPQQTKPALFAIKSSPLFSEVMEVPQTTRPNPLLNAFSDGELIDALEIYNIRIPEKAMGPDDSGNPIPAWFPSPEQIVLELNSRGYMVTRLRMGEARSKRYTDPMFFAAPSPDALPEQIARRKLLSDAKFPEFVDAETARTGQSLTTRKGREFKDWKLISALQKMSDREFVAFGSKLNDDERDMRRRKASGEIGADEYDAWANANTALRNTYQDVVAERRLRSIIASGEALTIENDPLVTPLDIAIYSRSEPNFRSQRTFSPVVQSMFDDGIIDENIYDSLADYAQIKREHQVGVKNRLSQVLGFDVDGELQPTLSPREMSMVRGVMDEYNDIYSERLSALDIADLNYGQLTALGIDKADAMHLVGDEPVSMRSRRGKQRRKWNITGEKKVTGNMKKQTPEQVRAEQEQRRRAKTIPAKKKQGPNKSEWREYRAMRSTRATGERANYLNDLASNIVTGRLDSLGRHYVPPLGNGQDGFISFGGDVKIGDVLPDNFLSGTDFQGDRRYVVMGSMRSSKGTSRVLLRDLKTGASLDSYISDDQQLLNVGRPTSMRSSRANIPVVRAEMLDDFRNLRHDAIKKRFRRAMEDYVNISAQRDALELQTNDDGELSEVDETRFGVLDDMLLALSDEMEELEQTMNYLLAEERQSQIDLLTREIALSNARQYTASQIEDLGLTPDDWKRVMSILEGDRGEQGILFDLPVSGRAKAMSASTLATDLNTVIEDFRSGSEISTPFGRFDIDDRIKSVDDLWDDDEKEAVDRNAWVRLRHAYSSVQREKELQAAKNTIINTTAIDITADDVLALAPSSRSARGTRPNGRRGAETGKGLPRTEQLFPGASGKFANSDVAFVNMDGNRNEVIVGKKNGNIIRYGGLSDSAIREFAFGRSSARQALNDIATNSRYVVDSSGRSRGNVPGLESLLKRDLERVNLSDRERSLVSSVIDGFTSGANSRSVASVAPENLHGLVARLFKNNEPAMAANILDAVDAVGISNMFRLPIAPLSRKFGDTPQNQIDIDISIDESGIIRDELSHLKKVFQANPNVVSGANIYDEIISNAQAGGMRTRFSISPAQYDEIKAAYEFAYKQKGMRPLSGFTPLEQASANPKFKFDTTEMGNLSGLNGDSLFNNGAPMSMTVNDQKKLLDWAQSSDIAIAKQIASEQRLTLNEWNGLRALRELSPISSRSSRSEFTRIDTTSGTSLKDARPQNYLQLTPIEKLAWLNANSASETNKKGVRRQDVLDEVNNIFELLTTASSNAEAKRRFESLAFGGRVEQDSMPVFARSWNSLNNASKEVLNLQSSKLYDSDFLDLNPVQAVDVLRMVRPEANKNKTGPLKIDAADIDALWTDAILSSQKSIDATTRKMRSGSLSEEDVPTYTPTKLGSDNAISSTDNSLSQLLTQTAVGRVTAEQTRRQVPTSSRPDNPIAARQQRNNRAAKLSLFVDDMSEQLRIAYSSRNDDNRHGIIWDDLGKLFNPLNQGEARDLTFGQLDDAIDLLDDYLSSDIVADALSDRPEAFGPRATGRAKRAVLDNIGNAEGLRNGLQKIRESYSDDPFIDRTPSRGAKLTKIIAPQNNEPAIANRVKQNRIPDVEKYFAARRNEQQAPSSMRSQKEGRAEIRAEATRFKELMDSLDVEAQKTDDQRTRAALLNLKQIMRRQKSALLTDKRTNAGAIFLTQSELDEIIEALYVALDRQMGRGSEDRTALFAEMAELMAKAAMATFVNKTVQPVNSRTMTKLNEQGQEVEVALYE